MVYSSQQIVFKTGAVMDMDMDIQVYLAAEQQSAGQQRIQRPCRHRDPSPLRPFRSSLAIVVYAAVVATSKLRRNDPRGFESSSAHHTSRRKRNISVVVWAHVIRFGEECCFVN